MMLATKWTGCKAPTCEHSSQQLSLDVCPPWPTLSLSGLWQRELAAPENRAGSDVGTLAWSVGYLPSWDAAPRRSEVSGPRKGQGTFFTPHSQIQLCHLREPKSTTLMRSSDSASPMAQKSSSVFTSKLSLFALGVIVF